MTVPESAAAVFERVLGDLAARWFETPRVRADGFGTWVLNEMPQLATALCDDLSRSEGKSSELSDSVPESLTAQPDTLGDGGGVVERIKALHRPRTVRIPYSDNHKVPSKQECAHCHRPYPCPTIDAATQQSATSERGGKDG